MLINEYLKPKEAPADIEFHQSLTVWTFFGSFLYLSPKSVSQFVLWMEAKAVGRHVQVFSKFQCSPLMCSVTCFRPPLVSSEFSSSRPRAGFFGKKGEHIGAWVIVNVEPLRQPHSKSLRAILAVFSHSSLDFSCLKAVGKYKKCHNFCARALLVTLRHCVDEQRHIEPLSLRQDPQVRLFDYLTFFFQHGIEITRQPALHGIEKIERNRVWKPALKNWKGKLVKSATKAGHLKQFSVQSCIQNWPCLNVVKHGDWGPVTEIFAKKKSWAIAEGALFFFSSG